MTTSPLVPFGLHFWPRQASSRKHNGQHGQHQASVLVDAEQLRSLIWELSWYRHRILHKSLATVFMSKSCYLTFTTIIGIYEKIEIGAIA